MNADLAQEILVDLRQYHSRMAVAAVQAVEHVDGPLRLGRAYAAYREGDQDLVCMEAGIVVPEMLYLQMLDRRYDWVD